MKPKIKPGDYVRYNKPDSPAHGIVCEVEEIRTVTYVHTVEGRDLNIERCEKVEKPAPEMENAKKEQAENDAPGD